MAHLSSNFSAASAGRITVLLQGVYYHTTRRDAGFPSGADPANSFSNYAIRGYVGLAGAYQYTQPIDRYAPSVVAEFDYPGGNVIWNYGTEFVAETHTGLTGLYAYGLANLRMTITLRPNT